MIAAFALGATLAAQTTAAAQDSATFDSDGTAHPTRVVPMPVTVSPEAQKWLASLTRIQHGPESLAERRARTDVWRKKGRGRPSLHRIYNH